LALDSSIWDGVVERLAGRAEILTYDCRGHGRSGRQAGRFTTELFARDLLELLDHVGWQKVIIAGCSMGGCVVQAFAGQYASRVAALALIDTTAWYGEDAPKTWRQRAATAEAQGLAGLVDFQMTRWFGDAFRAAHPESVGAAIRVFLANDLACYDARCILLVVVYLRRLLHNIAVQDVVFVWVQYFATQLASGQFFN